MNKVLVIFVFTIFISNCSKMSKSECINANWEFIGQHDGLAGAGSLAQQRGLACAKYKVEVNRSLYIEGFKRGAKVYCNPEAVFEYALHGQGNYKNCPLEMQNELRPYYNAAKNYYDAKTNVELVEYKIAQAKGRLVETSSKEMSDYYRGVIAKNSELLDQAKRNLNEVEIEFKQFKKNRF